ncbi:MAG: thiamine phosphate synthase [Planctomycetota bacterium]
MNNSVPDNSTNTLLAACWERAVVGLRSATVKVRETCGERFLATRMDSLVGELESVFDKVQGVSQSRSGDELAQTSTTTGPATIHSAVSDARQALRTLGDVCKKSMPDAPSEIERVEIEFDILERAILITDFSCKSLNGSGVCVLTSGTPRTNHQSEVVDHVHSLDASAFVPHVQLLIEGGAEFIQLRDKRLTDRELIKAGRILTEQTRNTKTRWIMNDRADLALVTGADGVHLGQDDIPVSSARQILGATGLIGVSTHNVEQANQAVLDGANYIGVGPVFPSETKSFESFPGLQLVEQVASAITLPAFAIGGISLQNISQVVEAGMHRVAVSSAVCSSNDLSAATQAIARALKNR